MLNKYATTIPNKIIKPKAQSSDSELYPIRMKKSEVVSTDNPKVIHLQYRKCLAGIAFFLPCFLLKCANFALLRKAEWIVTYKYKNVKLL